MSLNDWLVATLACVTIALGVLGILIALMAIWGYQGIKTEARNLARDEARRILNELFDEEGTRATLTEEVGKRVEIEADRLFYDLSLANAFPKQQPESERSAPIAEEYPPEG